jgi:carotenoid cleavage dioxygenase-like enzyme
MSTSTLTFLEGGYAPVREEVTAQDLAVTGTIPPELTGRLVRIGPNPITQPNPATTHWFLGTGMVHGVHLRNGRAEWYRNRYVRDAAAAKVLGVDPPAGDRPDDGVVNTHVIGYGGRTLALVEAGSRPMELSYELDTVARCDFAGTLDGSFAAHTKLDPDSGELHAVTYSWAWDHIRHVVVGTDGRVRRELRVPVAGAPMVHDCAITERFVVLLDLPVTFDLDAAAAGAELPYRWNPEHPSRVGLLPREGAADEVRWFEAPVCYVFHTLNAYDLPDGRVVVDVVRHPRMFATVTNRPSEGRPTLERWTLDPGPAGPAAPAGAGSGAGGLRVTPLDDTGQEFPRVDDRLIGRRHRFGYGAVLDDNLDPAGAVKHDLDGGTSEIHDYGEGRVTLEPVFVPQDAGAAEDDGWVLSTVYDATTGLSDVVILHAQDFTGDPVATIHLPARVPFGFHGSWIPD